MRDELQHYSINRLMICLIILKLILLTKVGLCVDAIKEEKLDPNNES